LLRYNQLLELGGAISVVTAILFVVDIHFHEVPILNEVSRHVLNWLSYHLNCDIVPRHARVLFAVDAALIVEMYIRIVLDPYGGIVHSWIVEQSFFLLLIANGLIAYEVIVCVKACPT